MKILLCWITFAVFTVTGLYAQSDEQSIKQLITKQQNAWNNGDLRTFMQGYWESDSLMFVGKSGVTYGYKKTLENYQQGYPDTAAMGKLTFDFIEFKSLSKEYYFVTGMWHLKRTIGNLDGAFTLLLRKIRNRWVIVKDHSS